MTVQVIAAVLLKARVLRPVVSSIATDVSEELSITGSAPPFPEDAAVERRFSVGRRGQLSQQQHSQQDHTRGNASLVHCCGSGGAQSSVNREVVTFTALRSVLGLR